MKKFLGLIITLSLLLVFANAKAEVIKAEVIAPDCTTNRIVTIHYHRWNGDYEGLDLWTWGNGTNGSVNNIDFAGFDDFGAVAYYCVDDDADDQSGLIPRNGDWTYKDGIDLDANNDVDNKWIPLKEDGAFVGFDENGMKHVYVLQGSADVYTSTEGMPFFQEDGFGTKVVVYYDPSGMYDGWNIWTWDAGTDGSVDAVDFQWNLGIDQGQDGAQFRVAVLKVAADAADSIGFIVRTDAWEKKYEDNILLDVTNIKGSGVDFDFYIAGEDSVYDTFDEFEGIVNFFEISEAIALDPNSISIEFNKDVITSEDDVIVFDETSLTVTDKDGTAVTIDSVSFNSTSAANTLFTLILEDELVGSKSPYTVTYTVGEDSYTKEFDVDSTAPTIAIVGSTDVELELGDTYSLPNFSASDLVGDETEPIYNVRVKDGHGTVDTRFAGVYEIVIEASDKFGNSTEETITVTVLDPCDETAHLDANISFGTEIIAIIISAPLALGAFIALRRGQ